MKYAIKIKTMLKLYLSRLEEHGKLIYKFYGFITYAPTQINSQPAHAFYCIHTSAITTLKFVIMFLLMQNSNPPTVKFPIFQIF